MNKKSHKFIKYFVLSVFSIGAIATIPTAIIISNTEQSFELTNGSLSGVTYIDNFPLQQGTTKDPYTLWTVTVSAPKQNVQNPEQLSYKWYYTTNFNYDNPIEVVGSTDSATANVLITRTPRWFFCVITYQGHSIKTPLKFGMIFTPFS